MFDFVDYNGFYAWQGASRKIEFVFLYFQKHRGQQRYKLDMWKNIVYGILHHYDGSASQNNKEKRVKI